MSMSSIENKLDQITKRLGLLEHRLSHLKLVETSSQAQATQAEGKRPEAAPLAVPNAAPAYRRLHILFQTHVWAPIAVLLTIAGGASSYTALRYDVSVSYLTSLNSNAPFESRFLITNNSPFSILNVTYFCASAHVHVNDGREIQNITRVREPIEELRAHASYSVRCQHWLGETHIDSGAFMQIYVSYYPRFLPWLQKQGGQQFVLKYERNGSAIWLPVAWLTNNLAEMEKEEASP